MLRHIHIPVLVITLLVSHSFCQADPIMPNAWASFSWIPHGYGATMRIDNPTCAQIQDLYGFRICPHYVGSWSEPVWGWDVHCGPYFGPPVSYQDPGKYQLPIGLIYPNSDR